ncbi:MAG: hypothetical protein WBD58_20820 [Geitlerinemataceae cyanobacterium]
MKKADKFVPFFLAGVATVILIKGRASEQPYHEDARVILEIALLTKDCLKEDEDDKK